MRLRLGLMFSILLFSFNAIAADWLHQIILQKGNPATGTKSPGHSFFNDHRLLFFYGSQCPHCQRFAPILKRWSQHNEAQVLAVSLDNQPLPEFPHFILADKEWINAAFQTNPIQYPALFIIGNKNKILYPVGFGAMGFEEMEDRMQQLIPKIKAYELKRGSL